MANPYLWAGLMQGVGSGVSSYLDTRQTLQDYMRQQAQQERENKRAEAQLDLQTRQQTRLEEQDVWQMDEPQREVDMLRFQQQMGRENEQWKSAQPMSFVDALAAAGEQSKTLGGAAGQAYLRGALQSGKTALPGGMAGGQRFIEQFAGAPAGAALPSVVGAYIPEQTPTEIDMARKAFDTEQSRKLRRVTIAKDTILGFLRQAPVLGAVNWNEVRGIIDQQLSAIGETGIAEEELKAAVAQAQGGMTAGPAAPAPAKLPAIQPTPGEKKSEASIVQADRSLAIRQQMADIAAQRADIAAQRAEIAASRATGGGRRGTGGGGKAQPGKSDIIPLTAPEIRTARQLGFNTPAIKQGPGRIGEVFANEKYFKLNEKGEKSKLNALGIARVKKINAEEAAIARGEKPGAAKPAAVAKPKPTTGHQLNAADRAYLLRMKKKYKGKTPEWIAENIVLRRHGHDDWDGLQVISVLKGNYVVLRR